MYFYTNYCITLLILVRIITNYYISKNIGADIVTDINFSITDIAFSGFG